MGYNQDMVNFKEKLKDVPENPGVYLMLDKDDNIIYVGKAKNLKNRLRQYFHNSVKTVKVMAMLDHVADFRYIICGSEVDALVTENNLIKKHTPQYNILLKDDKSYPFVRINLKEDYPSISLVRALKNDGAKYFGPYMQSVNIRDIFDLIHSAFPIRDCNRDMTKPSRPCLNAHLGRCVAPCSGKVTKEEYRKEVMRVVDFLKGNDREVERVLTDKMMEFADKENFEVALKYKEKLAVLEKVVRKQVSALPKDFNLDVFAYETNGVKTAVNMLVVRGGKLVGGENSVFDGIDDSLTSYLYQFYKNNPPVCDEIITDGADDNKALEDALSTLVGRKIHVLSPKQGVRKQLLDLAHTNAHDALEKHGTQEERKTIRTKGAVKQLADLLSLKTLPNRIECYDISHVSGVDKVSSMVVFEGGEPKKSHYRKFKIKTVEGNNDFASMKETLSRRLERLNNPEEIDESFASVPDLIVIDGGKGQLSYALDALAIYGRTDVEILSLAEREEEVFLGRAPKESVMLSKDSVALQLLQRIRDEAHRFAITFHRNLHAKRMSESVLRDVPGIGKKKSADLLKKFGSVENILHAKDEDIAMLDGFSVQSATKLKVGLQKALDER
ncbi:MAG: excinuclease ABC subunit UvrC, partial [Clostridia bacterium]|nr:excinuclease ABC subunit UvrC [Clostridia bacterium]MBP3290883.1 excinuclease ABC subunit UvrC [Clostridia bacterium]